MKAGMDGTSGVLNCILIILCEGEHDYAFIREVLKRIIPNIEVKEPAPMRKDRIINDIINMRYPPYVPVIVEGGKSRLDKDIGILISRLRSIPRSFVRVLILRDSDSDNADDAFNELKSIIERKIESRFPQGMRPTLYCERKAGFSSFVLYDCTVRYVTGYEAFLSFILVIKDLEAFLSRYGFNNNDRSSLDAAIGNALNDPVSGGGVVNIFKRALGPCVTQ